MKNGLKLLAIAVVIMANNAVGLSDEGMWLYNDPPRQLLKERRL
jgi:hypothetical protein